jgi:hypothetical protein
LKDTTRLIDMYTNSRHVDDQTMILEAIVSEESYIYVTLTNSWTSTLHDNLRMGSKDQRLSKFNKIK